MKENLKTALVLFEKLGKISLITPNGEHEFKYEYGAWDTVQIWINILKVEFVKVGHLKIKVR